MPEGNYEVILGAVSKGTIKEFVTEVISGKILGEMEKIGKKMQEYIWKISNEFLKKKLGKALGEISYKLLVKWIYG